MSEPALDPAILASLRQAMEGSGVDLVRELIEMFLVDGPLSMDQVRAHRDAGDIDRLVGEVHSIKGSVANLGARALATLCGEVETAGRAKDLDGIRDLLPRLEAEFGRVLDALRVEGESAESTDL